jgi:hypothetical protein
MPYGEVGEDGQDECCEEISRCPIGHLLDAPQGTKVVDQR